MVREGQGENGEGGTGGEGGGGTGGEGLRNGVGSGNE